MAILPSPGLISLYTSSPQKRAPTSRNPHPKFISLPVARHAHLQDLRGRANISPRMQNADDGCFFETGSA
jgi:hypothetical protein